MEKQAIIRVQNVSKVYPLYDKPIDRLKESLSFTKKIYHRDHYALNNISFEVYKGETLGIIGTNGSGKSTLLKLLTRVIVPSNGIIEVNGKISALLELGAGFNPEYTGIENVYLNGTMMGYSKTEMEKRLESILNFADIGDFINQPVKTYSSGMFARLAFAVAINVEPDILIVDEALSVGDAFFQNKCFKKFDELKARGVTILFVSHDTSSVRQMCSRVLWIEQGEQQMLGESKMVCNAYANSIKTKSGGRRFFSPETEKEKRNYDLGTFELEDYPPIHHSVESQLNDHVRILTAFFLNKEGEITDELEVDEEYTFVTVFESDIEITQCITGFVIESTKGQWIINCNSAICGEKSTFSVRPHTAVKSEYRFKLPKLLEGDYIVGTAVSQGTIDQFQVITWMYQVLNIKIVNPGANSAVLDVDAEVSVFSTSQ
ncbi:ABC transporter ATP-binding protein [Angelakisella massiliensis]|uniref:ABC transporter ATP-binding protein n=1 Tax=Angelakisella massiliensis TaxID=1871018 RepID=UPI0008F8D3DA|nr:ABC transporter ATP-binding protein [Angelakisella massiliensis]